MRPIKLRASFLVFILICLTIPPLAAQDKKPPQGTTPGPPTTKTKLEVMGSCGPDCEQWVKTLTIESANKVTFRYSTEQQGATSAIWQVSDKPLSAASQMSPALAPHVIASGALGGVPAPGHVRTFDINFAEFAPDTPKTTLSYWVFVVTKDGRANPIGLASTPVKVSYHAPSKTVVDLSGIPGDNGTTLRFEGQDICAPCQSLVAPINKLEAQKNIASKNLKETKSSYWTGEVKDLLKQIEVAKQKLDQCVISKCGGLSTLFAHFTGRATMTTSNSDAKGPFKEDVTASVNFLKYDRTHLNIYLSTITVGPFKVPGGTNTTTITGQGSGTVNLQTGAMTITLALHLQQSNDFAGDSNLTITLSTSSGSPLNATGAVTLNGNAKFKDGFLGDDNCTMTIKGTISPHP